MPMTREAVFQSFEERSDRTAVGARIKALRARLAEWGADGFVVPRADRHQGEYVPACDERLAWLTGFTGSAGSAVILADSAALIVDGRYTLQAADQTDTGVVTPVQMAQTSMEDWIGANLPAGKTLGYDPWLHTPAQVAKLEAAVAKAGGTLRALEANPVDAIWQGRPAAPAAPVELHPIAFAGEEAAAKLGRVQAALTSEKVAALVISDPHNLAWLFNLRGGDVSHTPLPLGFAIVPADGPARIFMTPGKVSAEVRGALNDLATFAADEDFDRALSALGQAGGKVRLDRSGAPSALVTRIEGAGGHVDAGTDPITRMKAVKNEAEIAGARAAHRRDGASMSRYLAWLAREAPKGSLTEIDAVVALETFRREGGDLRDIAFPSISGAGPNGAIVHYRVTQDTNRSLKPGELFLIDSGAQYRDGTTDITRTIAVGPPTPEMRDRFTRVLKGHIAIATAVFPKGTSGAQIDALARMPLWQAGLDFDHGTGHGVGSYLSVHEGPQRISKLGSTPLETGMMLSNEPGYYKTGAFGIRIENLILVEPRAIEGAEREMLGFETLTLAPIDRNLVERALLTPDEITWLDAYHARVLAALAPDLDAEDRAWLEQACAPV